MNNLIPVSLVVTLLFATILLTKIPSESELPVVQSGGNWVVNWLNRLRGQQVRPTYGQGNYYSSPMYYPSFYPWWYQVPPYHHPFNRYGPGSHLAHKLHQSISHNENDSSK